MYHKKNAERIGVLYEARKDHDPLKLIALRNRIAQEEFEKEPDDVRAQCEEEGARVAEVEREAYRKALEAEPSANPEDQAECVCMWL